MAALVVLVAVAAARLLVVVALSGVARSRSTELVLSLVRLTELVLSGDTELSLAAVASLVATALVGFAEETLATVLVALAAAVLSATAVVSPVAWLTALVAESGMISCWPI